MKLTIFYAAVIVGLVVYLIFGHNGILKYSEMVNTQQEYENQINYMSEKIAYLERELDLMQKNNEYLEYVIRRELGLQKSDEDQYIIPNRNNATVPSK